MEKKGGGVISPAAEPAASTEMVVERIDEKVSETAEAATMETVVERIDEKVSEAAEVSMMEAVVERIEEKVSEAAAAAGERREEEPPGQGGGAAVSAETVVAGMPAMAVATTGPAGVGGSKKKRGRPRKYAPDGSLARPPNPRPLLASAPVGEYTPATEVGAVMKFGRGRPVVAAGSGEAPAAQYSLQLESAGTSISLLVLIKAKNFTLLKSSTEFVKNLCNLSFQLAISSEQFIFLLVVASICLFFSFFFFFFT